MQYLIVLSPIFLLFLSPSFLRKRPNELESLISLIEGNSHVTPTRRSELYELGIKLIEMRSALGPRVQTSLIHLKKEATTLNRKMKRIKSIRVSSYLQQFLMITLILVLILTSNKLFSFEGTPYLSLSLLQFLSLGFILGIEKLLSYFLVRPSLSRLKNIIIIKSLATHSLSVSRTLSHVDWEQMKSSKVKYLMNWDESFYKMISFWKKTGEGLDQGLSELESELSYITEVNFQKYVSYMESAKFIALLISGFLGYFLFLFSLLNSFLA